MSRPLARPAAAVTALAVLGALGWLAFGGADGDGGAARVEEAPDAPTGGAPAALAAAPNARTTGAEPVAVATEAPAPATRVGLPGASPPRRESLRGRVLDELGRPVSQAQVGYREAVLLPDGTPAVRPSPRFRISGREGARVMIGDPAATGERVPTALSLTVRLDRGEIRTALPGLTGRSGLTGPSAVSDVDGRFELFEVGAGARGQLLVRAPFHVGEPIEFEIEPRAAEQELRLPDLGATTPAVLLTVRDSETGDPLYPDELDLRLAGITIGGGVATLRDEPLDASIREGLGYARFLGLSPGTWEATVTPRRSLTGRVRFEVPVAGEPQEHELAVRHFDPALGWTSCAAGDGPVDPSAALLDHAAEVERATFGDDRTDVVFVHTLRGFGAGPFTEAWLEIDARALGNACSNDALHLERQPGGAWAYGTRLASVSRWGAWRAGSVDTLVVDLAPVLEHLADGALDLDVQDDTRVDAVRIHVRR